MSLPALFSLIAASLLTLLPLFLLLARNRARRRDARTVADAERPASEPDSAAGAPAGIQGRRAREKPREWPKAHSERARSTVKPVATAAPGATLEARLSRLSPLQRAVAYREILGPPAGLRDRGAGIDP